MGEKKKQEQRGRPEVHELLTAYWKILIKSPGFERCVFREWHIPLSEEECVIYQPAAIRRGLLCSLQEHHVQNLLKWRLVIQVSAWLSVVIQIL